jgi:hypothetical protein
MCVSLADSELSLVGIGRLIPPHLLKVCFAHKDKVEIKCMSSVGGKTPIEPKLHSYFSSLRHTEHDKLILCALFIVITWVTRSL